MDNQLRKKSKPDRAREWLNNNEVETPYLIVDLDKIAKQYHAIADAFSNCAIHYAVKANPELPVLSELVDAGSNFDVASVEELCICIWAGADAKLISYGNTIKKEADIKYAYQLGVRLFAFDSEEELLKISRAAPGAKVYCRLLVETTGATWPLSRKFGCSEEMAIRLLAKAAALDLIPYGVSFHVGSQQSNTFAWDKPIVQASRVFTTLYRQYGIELKLLNIGGGFPATYTSETPSIQDFADRILQMVCCSWYDRAPEIMLEPGRFVVGDAGVLVTDVVLVAKKEEHAEYRWVYLDAGKFNGLPETDGERIMYEIQYIDKSTVDRGPCVLAGPTCDSADILYEENKVYLPLDLTAGDRLYFNSAGAYTSSYASVEFNGFKPIGVYCI